MFNLLNNKKGITLIALIITIVVLLILAGITINLLFGQNGIILKANTATNMWDEAQKDEIAKIENMSDKIDEILDGRYNRFETRRYN